MGDQSAVSASTSRKLGACSSDDDPHTRRKKQIFRHVFFLFFFPLPFTAWSADASNEAVNKLHGCSGLPVVQQETLSVQPGVVYAYIPPLLTACLLAATLGVTSLLIGSCHFPERFSRVFFFFVFFETFSVAILFLIHCLYRAVRVARPTPSRTPSPPPAEIGFTARARAFIECPDRRYFSGLWRPPLHAKLKGSSLVISFASLSLSLSLLYIFLLCCTSVAFVS